MLYRLGEHEPTTDGDFYVAESATVLGKVRLCQDASIWFGAVLRGDTELITIGEGSNVQDLSMLHVIEEIPLIIGKHVTIGHSVVLHACTVGDGSLIGMQSCLLDGCEIGKNSLVAAGSLVPPGKKFPDNSMIMGNPAKVVRELRPDEIKAYSHHYLSYIGYKNEFKNDEHFEEIKK